MLRVNSLLPLADADEMDEDDLDGLKVVVKLLKDCDVMMSDKLVFPSIFLSLLPSLPHIFCSWFFWRLWLLHAKEVSSNDWEASKEIEEAVSIDRITTATVWYVCGCMTNMGMGLRCVVVVALVACFCQSTFGGCCLLFAPWKNICDIYKAKTSAP